MLTGMIQKLALRAALPTSALVLLSIAQGAAAPQAIPVNRQADTSQTTKILNPGVISWVHFGDLHITDASSQNYADFKSIIANTNRYLLNGVQRRVLAPQRTFAKSPADV